MKKEKILGLDIGVTSLGWAVGTYDPDQNNMEIDDFGVRIWEAPEDPKTLDTKMLQRRNARSQRRLRDRKLNRRRDLNKLFYNNNLVEKDIEIKVKNPNEPFKLRYKGLSEKLTNEELLIALQHLSKNRGYNAAFDINVEKELEKEINLEKRKKKLNEENNDKKNAKENEKDKELKGQEKKLEKAEILVEKYGTPIQALMEDKQFRIDESISQLENDYNLKYKNNDVMKYEIFKIWKEEEKIEKDKNKKEKKLVEKKNG